MDNDEEHALFVLKNCTALRAFIECGRRCVELSCRSAHVEFDRARPSPDERIIILFIDNADQMATLE